MLLPKNVSLVIRFATFALIPSLSVRFLLVAAPLAQKLPPRRVRKAETQPRNHLANRKQIPSLTKIFRFIKRAADEINGMLISKGSDTMSNLVTYWCDDFSKHYPSVKKQINHKGSSDAPVALNTDEATFGAMSRDWQPKEIDEFEKTHGFKPTNVVTCIDVLAVYVHKDNPIKGLSLQQIDAIFSTDRKGGGAKDITTWGDLGLTGDWADKRINLYGRDAASGTYKYFLEHALFKGTYKNSVNAQAGSSSVVGAIAADQYSIGYSGIGYKTADVKVVPLTSDSGANPTYVEADAKNAYSGDYPLARPLYLCLKIKPGEKLDPLRREFLKFVLSNEGQALSEKGDFIPITAKMANEELKKLQLQ